MRQIQVLDIIVKPEEFAVYRDGESLELPKLSFDLFLFLIDHPQQVCSVEQISAAVWGNTIVSNETIVQRITLLRKALNDDPKKPKYIESVRGRGYRLIAAASDVEPPKKPLAPRVILYVVGVLACIVIFWLVYTDQSELAVPDTSSAIAEYDGPHRPLLERADYYLAIGQPENIQRAIDLYQQVLVDEPTNDYALAGLSFAQSRQVCRYGKPRVLAEQANTLATQAINLNRSNSRAHVALAYAYDCIGNLEQALASYQQVTRLFPTNYRSFTSAAHLLETKGLLLEAFEYSMQAQDLQPNNPITNLQIARVYESLMLFERAESMYRELFILYPDNVFINEALPRFLLYQGRFSEAKTAFEQALARGVVRNDILLNYAKLIWLTEGIEPARPWFHEAVSSNPTYSFASSIAEVIEGRMTVEAGKQKIQQIETLVSAGNTWPINYIEAAVIALWTLDDPQQALGLLRKSIELGYLNSEYLRISPLFEALNNQPEFYQIIDMISQRRVQQQQAFLTAHPQR